MVVYKLKLQVPQGAFGLGVDDCFFRVGTLELWNFGMETLGSNSRLDFHPPRWGNSRLVRPL